MTNEDTLPVVYNITDTNISARFWAKVQIAEGSYSDPKMPLLGPCMLWRAAITGRGYGEIRVGGKMFQAHRIAWQLTNGPIPAGMELDHMCSNRACVNVAHLRLATRAQNSRFQLPQRGRSSSYKGVCWRKSRKKWCARIRVDGRLIYLGQFVDETEAARAYDIAAIERFGEFALLNCLEASA